MALRWYAGRTRPMAEYRARDYLEAAGIEVFLPCGKTSYPRRGRQDSPLFSGYLFVHYDLEEDSRDRLYAVPQFASLVSFKGVVPPIPDEAIDELARRVDAINGSGGLWRRYLPGEKVQVSLGPTESLAEVVDDASCPQARVRVLLEFLGQLVEARVPWYDVRPVGAQAKLSTRNRPTGRRTRGRGRWVRGFGPRVAEAVGV